MIGNMELKSNNLVAYPAPKKFTPYVKLKDFSHFAELVLKWAEERNLLKGATNKQQSVKLWEEAGELLKNHLSGKDTRDDVGDILVILVQMVYRTGASLEYFEESLKEGYGCNLGEDISVTNLLFSVGDVVSDLVKGDTSYCALARYLCDYCQNSKLDTLECCEIAYNDIRDRSGKMIDGNFVKDV